MTSGLLESAVSPCGMPGPQLVGGGEEAVAQPRVLLLVAELLEDVGEQILGLAVVGLGLNQLVHDLSGQQIVARVVQFAAPREDRRAPAHHLDVERRAVGRRQRDQRRGIAVPEAEVALDHAAGVVLRRTVVAAAVPLLLQPLRHFVDVVDLVDRHALVRQVQHLVVHVGVEVALAAQHLLDALVAPARPVVRGEHDLGLEAEAIERLADVFRPVQRVAHRRAAERVDVVQAGDHVFGDPQRLHVGDVGVHLPRRLGVRGVLEDHAHAVDLDLLDGVRDEAVRRDQPDGAGRHALAEALADIAVRARRQQQAILVEQPAVHRVAGIDVLGDREIHEVDRRDQRDLAGAHVGLVDDRAHPAPVVGMGVRIDHRRDRQPLTHMLLEKLPGGADGLGAHQRVEDDPAGLCRG